MFYIFLLITISFTSFMIYETRRYEVEHRSVELGKRLSGGREIKILHISDTHFKRKDGRKVAFLDALKDRKYDFVFITGDIIEESGAIDTCIRALSGFKARLGVYAVLGNHDYYVYKLWDLAGTKNFLGRPRFSDYRKLLERLKGIGIEEVFNSHRIISNGGDSRIAVVGIGDRWFKLDEPNKAVKGMERADTTLILLLAHNPESIMHLNGTKVDIAFCGHTHGGQIRFPLVGAVITRAKIRKRHASGLVRIKNTLTYVSRGLGNSRFLPFRFLCRPEAAVITIREKAKI